MKETNKVVLLIDRQIGINIKDGATPDKRNFTLYDPEETYPLQEVVAVTVELPVWEALQNDKHSLGDIEAIRGQLRLQLGG